MPTKLHFDKDETLTVDEDVSVVESAFRSVTPNPAAIVELTKKDKKVFVNVALVRYFSEYEQGSVRVHSL